ncbi:Pex13 protein [Colletotrichum costaricense]|uniref:NmrA-like family domain-containing protein 1 n=1 Tax=Colletotrichum costaricense TaxID=1209916 RepID=A0AAI9YYZ5_9PEZI|nr:Pex13 protein [Colletotrichum costaricense]KAK1528848.1 Pex13 protein [Colletotrichum costaricense]
MTKKIITVFGATGAQGGSVVNIFLNDAKLSKDWQVRGVTRDATKDSSKALAAKGVEVVAADLGDKASLAAAVKGASAVFAVTNYWDKMDKELEIQQGKNIADAALEAGVEHFIFSSLLDVNKLSKGALPDVYHFDSKAAVEEYIRTTSLPATFFLPGFYMANLPGGMFRQTPPDNAWGLSLPVPASAPIPLFDAATDTGKFVKGIVLHREKVLGKRVYAATSYVTAGEAVETFKKVYPEAGKTARFNELTHEQFKGALKGQGMPDFVAEEMLQNMRLLDEFGYYGGEKLDESHAIVEDKLTTWEEHVKNAKAFSGLSDPPAFSYPWPIPDPIFPSPLSNTSQNVVQILIFTASPIEVDLSKENFFLAGKVIMASPPKPWERAGAPTTAASITPMSAASIATPTPATSLSGGTPPAVPERPASLASTVDQNAAAYSRAGLGAAASPYGSYGGGAYSSPYSSPYSRMGSYGGYGGGMYGGGMYGGGYGGGMYGGGMYGGGMGMGGMGGMGGPNDPNSLTNRFNNSTQATFQMLEGIVGAFGGFAQMLESTYMATHSSFFAMVSVAEQFSNLRDTLGSILGIFTLMRWIRTLIAKITGRPPPADATALTPAAFAKFEGRSPIGPDGAPLGPPKASRKPLFFFLLAAFGLPYLMRKMINTMAASAEEEERRRMALAGAQQPLDPSKLDYCRLLYDYAPQPGNAVKDVDMEVRKGDLVAVLSKSDPIGNPSEWWRCRARDGRTGYLPSTYLEVIKRPGQPLAAIKGAPSDSSRSNSLTGAAPEKGPEIKTKIGDVSPESFQKSVFYN